MRHLQRCHARYALLLALVTTALGIRWNTRAAGGSDSYGYVSEAELWYAGHLHIQQDFVAQVPWPDARWSFAPLGYRPAPEGFSIIPTYSPGLPMVMALAKAVAGQCAIFWVVPIFGGLLVIATYGMGRQLGRPILGLAAAWLVAVSPVTLYMLMNPMSDVPAASAWAVAIVFVLHETPASALVAGAWAALAILIRPNLVPMAAVMTAWALWRDIALGRRSMLRMRAPRFAAVAGLGAIAVAIINQRLYGSPLSSGYGDVVNVFSLVHLPMNLLSYVRSMATTETPLALVGLASLGIPARWLWPTLRERQTLPLFAACVAIVWLLYLSYSEHDAWWYQRFLLPTWPMMEIGTASLIAALYRLGRPAARWIAVALVVALGVQGVTQATWRETFRLVDGERKYAEVARMLRSATPPGSVAICLLHSGSIRYYAGRLTLRWDNLPPRFLDRAVAWLDAHGHHPYVLVEEDERDQFRRRFGATDEVGRLDWLPLVTLDGGPPIHLYDASRRESKRTMRFGRRPAIPRCEKPVTPPSLENW